MVDRGIPGRGTGRTVNDRRLDLFLIVICWRTCSSTQQIVALSTTESEYISTKDVAHALKIRSDLAECDMTIRIKGKNGRDSWACNGRETWSWPRAPPGCAIIMAAAVVGRRRGSIGVCVRAFLEKRNEADLESKKIYSTLLLKGNTPWTTNEFIELEPSDGGSKFSPRLRQQETVVCQSGT